MALNETIEKAALFKGLTSGELSEVASLARAATFAAGERIFAEGNYGEEIHILTRGMVRIELAIGDDSDCTTVHRFTAGQVFGELSLADRRNRSATAECESECKVVSIPCNELLKLFEKDLRIGYVVMKNLSAILATRLRKTNSQLISTVLWE